MSEQASTAVLSALNLGGITPSMFKLMCEIAEKLDEAAEDIEEWGGYADEYFQNKYKLPETVQAYRDYAAEIRVIAKNLMEVES